MILDDNDNESITSKDNLDTSLNESNLSMLDYN